jgi:NADH-quinone oxidoreductase subunit M
MHTRLINNYGGLVSIMPKYSIVLMVFTLGAIGLPGTSGFIGEFLILVGTFKKSFLVATIASLGVILSAAYMLWLYKRIIFGAIIKNELKKLMDLNKSELLILSLLVFPIILFGFYPEPLLSTVEVSLRDLIEMYNNNINLKKN